jgi:hypothetical protein
MKSPALILAGTVGQYTRDPEIWQPEIYDIFIRNNKNDQPVLFSLTHS